jgi:glutamine synthetase
MYKLTAEERQARGIVSLPTTLSEALDEMEKDSLVRKVLGDNITDNYLAAKRLEWDRYRQSVSQWEFDEYLRKF